MLKPAERNPAPPRFPAGTSKLIAIGVKAGKSRRLIAQELNVTETTIRRGLRDLKAQGITANKKPTATRRKPVCGLQRQPVVRPRIGKLRPQNPIRPHRPTSWNKGISPRIVVPRPFKPRQPSPELSPEPRATAATASRRDASVGAILVTRTVQVLPAQG